MELSQAGEGAEGVGEHRSVSDVALPCSGRTGACWAAAPRFSALQTRAGCDVPGVSDQGWDNSVSEERGTGIPSQASC